MAKLLLKKAPVAKNNITAHHTNKLLSELLPDMRQSLREAARDLMQPREQAIAALLQKAAEMK